MKIALAFAWVDAGFLGTLLLGYDYLLERR
jgi:hypothetical protein